MSAITAHTQWSLIKSPGRHSTKWLCRSSLTHYMLIEYADMSLIYSAIREIIRIAAQMYAENSTCVPRLGFSVSFRCLYYHDRYLLPTTFRIVVDEHNTFKTLIMRFALVRRAFCIYFRSSSITPHLFPITPQIRCKTSYLFDI